jgi:DNA-binding Lrp family transcriptional regulator
MDETRELLDLLRHSARESTADIARQLDMTEAAVDARIAELEEAGVIRGYQAIVDWSQLDDERVTAMVELNVELDRETKYTDISKRIAKFPEVSDLKLVSGDFDFAVEVVGDSMHDVSMFVSERIAPIPEVTQTVTHFVMDTYKERGIEFGDHSDDDRLSFSP